MYDPAANFAENPATLEAAVAELDPIVALLSLIHITGDQTLLHRYGPLLEGTQEQKREAFVDFGETEHKEADPAVVAEIRDRLLKEMRGGKPEARGRCSCSTCRWRRRRSGPPGHPRRPRRRTSRAPPRASCWWSTTTTPCAAPSAGS